MLRNSLTRLLILLINHNIKHELSAPYTPEQNGRIEMENRTIAELARTMILNNNLLKLLWAEAMSTGVYVLNLIPNKCQQNITPPELFTTGKT